MRKFAVMVLAVMLAGVMCEASFAALERCSYCFGTGEQDCGLCSGSGICQGCYGKGTVGYTPDFSGNGSGGPVECPSCHGDRKCDKCHGSGKITCWKCGGTGKTYTFDPLPNLTPTPTPDTNTTPKTNTTPDTKPESLSSETASKIAQALGTTSDSVSYIASSDMAAPQAPTSRITGALDILGLEIISTQGSLNVSQSGYYAFPMTVPANLVGTNTKLTVYVADRDEFGSASFSPSAVTLPLTTAKIFTESGGEVTTLPKTIIAAANLGADTARTFSTHIAKASSGSNTGGNNNTGNNTNGNNGNGDNTNNNTNTPEGVSSSGGGGGGCNSFTAILALTALILIRKSRR